MCGRYSLSKNAGEIAERFNVDIPEGFQGKLFNAAPSQNLPVIAMELPARLQLFQWGIKPPWKNARGNHPLLINARAESLHQKKIFSNLIYKQRCIIPADGFFEWEKTGHRKQPWRFLLKNEALFAFAGVYDVYKNTDGSTSHTFSIITTAANSLLEGIHDRMPVILDQKNIEVWFKETAFPKLRELLQPFPAAKMERFKVSPKINSSSLNLPELILPWQDPDLTLF